MSMQGVRICVKCGSSEFRTESVGIPMSLRDQRLGAIAYICKKCGYIELYYPIYVQRFLDQRKLRLTT